MRSPTSSLIRQRVPVPRRRHCDRSTTAHREPHMTESPLAPVPAGCVTPGSRHRCSSSSDRRLRSASTSRSSSDPARLTRPPGLRLGGAVREALFLLDDWLAELPPNKSAKVIPSEVRALSRRLSILGSLVAEPKIADRLKACGQVAWRRAFRTTSRNSENRRRVATRAGGRRGPRAGIALRVRPHCRLRPATGPRLHRGPARPRGRHPPRRLRRRPQSAAAGFARHLFSSLPPVTLEGLRPLR